MLPYIPQNIEIVADYIVKNMSRDELEQFVFDDLYAAMCDDPDTFYCNVDDIGEDKLIYDCYHL